MRRLGVFWAYNTDLKEEIYEFSPNEKLREFI
jgi:hypothetical protein